MFANLELQIALAQQHTEALRAEAWQEGRARAARTPSTGLHLPLIWLRRFSLRLNRKNTGWKPL